MSRTKQDQENFSSLVSQRYQGKGVLEKFIAWKENVYELLTESSAIPLIDTLRDAGATIPEVGYDLEDERGTTIGAMAELCWPSLSVAVVLSRSWESSRRKPAPHWKIFEMKDLLVDALPLLQELGLQQGGT